MSIGDELAKLNQLREDGVLSDEEFNAQKSNIASGNASTRKKKSKRGLIIGLSIGIPLLVLAILLPILLSGPSINQDTPASLAESVIEVIAADDEEAFGNSTSKRKIARGCSRTFPRPPRNQKDWISG